MKTVRLALVALLLFPAAPALAHKVVAAVYASGDVIEGEIGFSNGDMAPNALVEVFDDDGNKLGETTTDADGFFTFQPAEPVVHIFRSNLGAGHVADIRMEIDELPEIAGAAAVDKLSSAPDATATDTEDETRPVAATVDLEALMAEQRRIIAEAVQKQIIPLRRDIDAYKEKNDLQSIIGGIGYIFGLFGLGFYVAARRKLQKG